MPEPTSDVVSPLPAEEKPMTKKEAYLFAGGAALGLLFCAALPVLALFVTATMAPPLWPAPPCTG